MKLIKRSLLSCLASAALGLACAVAQAHDFKLGSLTIDHPNARATNPGQAVGGGFFKITNGGAADRLLSARAEVSGSVELHTMRMEGDVMRMRQLEAIELPAGQTVELKPGGMHLMFMGLKAPLKAGDSFPMTLRFEKAGEVTVQVKIEAPGQAAAPDGKKHMH